MRPCPAGPSFPAWTAHGRPDRRKSASINATLMLVAALFPLLGAIDTANIDHLIATVSA